MGNCAYCLDDVGREFNLRIQNKWTAYNTDVNVVMVIKAPRGICAVFGTPCGGSQNGVAEEQARAVRAFVEQHRG